MRLTISLLINILGPAALPPLEDAKFSRPVDKSLSSLTIGTIHAL
jgi:hypothetical protein